MSLTRRQFLKRSLAAAGAVSVPLFVSSHVFGANDEIRIGIVGCGVRGRACTSPRSAEQKGVRDRGHLRSRPRRGWASAPRKIEKNYGYKPDRGRRRPQADGPQGYRRGLDRHDAILARAAHDLGLPGRQARLRARSRWRTSSGKAGRWSTPRGSTTAWCRSARSSRSHEAGHAGDGQVAQGRATSARSSTSPASPTSRGRSIGKRTEPLPIPETLDYDLWCGPARKEPIYRDQLQYDCSFTWNMGDGESCNQGVHEIDMARWLLGETGLPRRTMSIGGRFVFNDAGDVPNTQIIYYDFPDGAVLYEVHNLRAAQGLEGRCPTSAASRTDICVQCEGGYVMIPDGTVFDNAGQEDQARSRGGETTSRTSSRPCAAASAKTSTPTCSEATSRRPSATPATSPTAWASRPRSRDARAVKDTPLFAEMFDRLLVHLKAHEVDADARPSRSGRGWRSTARRSVSRTTPRPTSWSAASTASRTCCRSWTPESVSLVLRPRRCAMDRRTRGRGFTRR